MKHRRSFGAQILPAPALIARESLMMYPTNDEYAVEQMALLVITAVYLITFVHWIPAVTIAIVLMDTVIKMTQRG